MPARIPEEVRIKQINEIPNVEFYGWLDGYKNKESKAIVRCSVDGYEWAASINNLINHTQGCPQCSSVRRWTADERVEQINSIGNVEFVRWNDEYKNQYSKVIVRCKADGFEWSARNSCVANGKSGCPRCGSKRSSDLKRNSQSVMIEKINSVPSLSFVRWEDGEYKNIFSRVIIRCAKDGFEWKTTASHIIHSGSGCPSCARHGYDPSKNGTLYALISECGRYVKIGISNKPNQRHKQLVKATPFNFTAICQIEYRGNEIAALEKRFHSRYESACLYGFDGATEWLLCTDDLLQEIRNTRDSLHQGV